MTDTQEDESRSLLSKLKKMGLVTNTDSGSSASRGFVFSQWYRYSATKQREGFEGHVDITTDHDDKEFTMIYVSGWVVLPGHRRKFLPPGTFKYARDTPIPVRDICDHLFEHVVPKAR